MEELRTKGRGEEVGCGGLVRTCGVSLRRSGVNEFRKRAEKAGVGGGGGAP